MRRQEGTHEANVAARPQKRRQEGTHEVDVAARSQKRRQEGTHVVDVAVRSRKRRQDGTHEVDVAVRSKKRRQEGSREVDVAVRSQKRRQEIPKRKTTRRDRRSVARRVLTRPTLRRDRRSVVRMVLTRPKLRYDLRIVAMKVHMSRASQRVRNCDAARLGWAHVPIPNPNSPESGHVVDLEDRIRVLCYRAGVSYKKPTAEESPLIRDRRRERLKLLARRTGRAETWRDECPIEDRAAAIGVSLKGPPKGKELATARANRKYVIDREAAFLRTKPVLPPAPSDHRLTRRTN